MNQSILFIVGLTGVGKSTTLKALQSSSINFELLPNRRELADTIIIPEVQKAEGKEPKVEKDRLERFRLTAKYRELYPGGMVHALQVYLASPWIEGGSPKSQRAVIFDNIRGLDECKAAAELFTGSRFIFLDAPAIVRLKRLIGRDDSFDHVATTPPENRNLIEKLRSLHDVEKVFDSNELAKLARTDGEESKLLDAVKIILTEHQNYNSREAANYLQSKLATKQLLYLDTSQLSINEVTKHIQDWL